MESCGRAIVLCLCPALISVAGGSGLAAPPAAPASSAPSLSHLPRRAAIAIAPEQAIPVVRRADVLVVGSSLDGCFLAQRLAEAGRRVVLTAAGTSLPREMAMALRPWVRRTILAAAPKDVRTFLDHCKRQTRGDEIILNMIRLTEGLEDRLLDRGAAFYYDLQPCGVRRTGRRATAVVFACKGGLVAIEASVIVDCTPDARVAALAGAELAARASAAEGAIVRYSMLCKDPPRAGELAAAGVERLADGRVLFHSDFAEFRVRLPAARRPFCESAYDLEARRVAAEAAAALKAAGALGGATFVRGGDVVLADSTVRIASRAAEKKLSPDACRPKGVDNVLVCGPAADVDDATARALVERSACAPLVDVLTAAPWDALMQRAASGKQRLRLSLASPASGQTAEAEARFTELSCIYRTRVGIAVDGAALPVLADCDVLVVGAGTSGVPAAIVAAQEGAETIAVEKYGDVGGTHTIGGVCKYWFGRRTNFVRRLDAAAPGATGRTAMPKCMGLLDAVMKAGVHLLTHCPAVGAAVEGRRVTGAVVVTPAGLGVIRARRVVDATGDGDIAARAGASVTYGTRRDAMTLWYSFARYRGTNPEAARHFDCVVDLRDPTDVTRAMVSSRRRGRARSAGDFPQVYLTPRESRHVRGRYTLTVADILAGRRFEDFVLVCKANFDIKGIADSDLFLCGYIERGYTTNYAVQVPYRALLPEGLENVLVVGKAYSVTHDALALARMQRDLMAMGGAAGLAAARSARSRRPLAGIDVKKLQGRLVELGVLTAADLESVEGVKGSALPPLSDAALGELVDRLAAGKLELADKVAILARPRRAADLLKAALPAAGDGKAAVAKALCFLGESAGADVLLAELRRRLAAGRLPMKMFRKQNPSPDHGYAPEIAYLVNTLGRLGERRVAPLLAEIARRVEMNPARSDMMFQYVHSVCWAAERLGDPACVEALTILADKPGLGGGVLPRGTDPRKTADRKADRYAYLELCVGRALARCGSRRGYEIVVGYLGDVRGFLARSAHDELVSLSGRDLGYDAARWRRWAASAKMRSVPLR